MMKAATVQELAQQARGHLAGSQAAEYRRMVEGLDLQAAVEAVKRRDASGLMRRMSNLGAFTEEPLGPRTIFVPTHIPDDLGDPLATKVLPRELRDLLPGIGPREAPVTMVQDIRRLVDSATCSISRRDLGTVIELGDVALREVMDRILPALRREGVPDLAISEWMSQTSRNTLWPLPPGNGSLNREARLGSFLAGLVSIAKTAKTRGLDIIINCDVGPPGKLLLLQADWISIRNAVETGNEAYFRERVDRYVGRGARDILEEVPGKEGDLTSIQILIQACTERDKTWMHGDEEQAVHYLAQRIGLDITPGKEKEYGFCHILSIDELEKLRAELSALAAGQVDEDALARLEDEYGNREWAKAVVGWFAEGGFKARIRRKLEGFVDQALKGKKSLVIAHLDAV